MQSYVIVIRGSNCWGIGETLNLVSTWDNSQYVKASVHIILRSNIFLINQDSRRPEPPTISLPQKLCHRDYLKCSIFMCTPLMVQGLELDNLECGTRRPAARDQTLSFLPCPQSP